MERLCTCGQCAGQNQRFASEYCIIMRLILDFITKILLNRYLLAFTAFVVWMVFFDRNDFFTQQQRKAELKELETKIGYYEKQLNEAENELANLQNNPSLLEKYAREKYFMKRDNEDVYVFETPVDSVKY
jgi:cell division protein FtsB